MANSLVNPTWVMKQIGVRLVNNMRFANNVDRSYSDEFKQSGAKVGYTVNARLPQRYQVSKGQALNPSAIVDNIVPITLTDQANIGLEFSMASLTMEVDNYRQKCIEPAVDALINQVDYDGLSRMYKKVAKVVGTPAVVPGSTGTLPGAANIVYMQAVVKLANYGVSTSSLKAMLSPNMHAYLSSANFTLFNPSAAISKMYKTGQFGGEALGVSEWYMDQNVATHTVGPLGGTPLVDGVPTEGSSSILTKGWTSSAAERLHEGDVIQFAGCYDINSMNYQANASLKDFVVTANVNGTSGGAATIPISPAMITTGAWATCSALPADSAVITIFGHASSYANAVTPQGLIYAPGAFALVFADLEKPGGLWVAERISNRALGIAVRFLKDYSIMTDQSPARVDLMYGWAAVREEFSCRVCS
jgi:hypothetical protein